MFLPLFVVAVSAYVLYNNSLPLPAPVMPKMAGIKNVSDRDNFQSPTVSNTEYAVKPGQYPLDLNSNVSVGQAPVQAPTRGGVVQPRPFSNLQQN